MYGVIFQKRETFHNQSSQNRNLAEEIQFMELPFHENIPRISNTCLAFLYRSFRCHIFSLSLLAFLLHFLLLRIFQFTIHNWEQQEEQYVKYYIAERQHTKPKETVLHGQVLVVFLHRLENITLLLYDVIYLTAVG